MGQILVGLLDCTTGVLNTGQQNVLLIQRTLRA